nr:MAG TPA: hypothetical protein [Caudoviricetes sp.]
MGRLRADHTQVGRPRRGLHRRAPSPGLPHPAGHRPGARLRLLQAVDMPEVRHARLVRALDGLAHRLRDRGHGVLRLPTLGAGGELRGP